MHKTIMLIGAGKFQMPGILKAREMGIKTVVIDRDPAAPGLKVADVPMATDVLDIDGALKIARKNKIDGVLTIASDIALPTVAAVADALDLPGISPEVARNATNKALMREKFKKYGVPSPEFIPVQGLGECSAACIEIGFPVVIKPVDNAGSRGVSKVKRREDIKKAFSFAKKFSRTQNILVEKFIDGKEIAVDAIIYQKKMHVLAISDKIRTKPPYLLDTTVIFPTEYTQVTLQKIIDIAEYSSIEVISMDNCPLHMEIMMSKEGPKVIELAARGAGFKVFTDILPMITGVDTLEASIKLALGLKPNLVMTQNKAAVLYFFKNRPGKLRSIRGLDSINKLEGIIDCDIYVKPGDRIKPLTSGSDRIGHVITLADNRNAAIRIMNRVKRIVKFDVNA